MGTLVSTDVEVKIDLPTPSRRRPPRGLPARIRGAPIHPQKLAFGRNDIPKLRGQKQLRRRPRIARPTTLRFGQLRNVAVSKKFIPQVDGAMNGGKDSLRPSNQKNSEHTHTARPSADKPVRRGQARRPRHVGTACFIAV